ncbi:hypothetical protein NKI54_00840 [Mesorhizobium sp. M0663]|uniref:hypothetical protein n=1 Tax=unclassified Mesorhizobium TaxID=325217 RepID=UPI003337D66C
MRKIFSWVGFGFVLTGIYFVAVVWVIWSSGPESYIKIKTDLQLNEFADALAGMFAPLAFLWLFIATMVQSQELALQRDELRLTRLEFQQNRQVAKQQAAEAHNQAKFIGEQTTILQRAETDKLVEVQLEGFLRRCFEIASRSLAVQSGEGYRPFHFQSEPKNGLRTAAYTVTKAASGIREVMGNHPGSRLIASKRDLTELQDRLLEMREYLAVSSFRLQAKFRNEGFEDLVDQMQFLAQMCSTSAHEEPEPSTEF